ncbi:hypothetical protein EDD36DRAFT_149362 [Exophiala viscosa]|uniref:NAD(P)-binding protein n=1 Tax=Exophiala viscosa TaxID=2486360 RepID=A0AAN6IG86_9EURO|nr:hypothetical protein EDD36DRAFT_149362 [Exophiala viscosa]
MSLKGQTAYVTGGASGIGRAVTAMLVEKGIKVYIADLNKQGAESVAKELNDKAGSQVAWSVGVDVTDWDSQVAGFEAAIKDLGGRIDYVYPIAGIAEVSWLPNRPNQKGFVKPNLSVWDVDGTGVLYTCAIAIQQFRRQEPNNFGSRGKIAAVSSVRGLYACPAMPVYSAAKFGVVGFVRAFGKFLPREKISINAICPAIVKTGINIGRSNWYEEAEKLDLVVKMESLINAFESLLGGSDVSGECIEIPAGKTDAPNGWILKPQNDFTTSESEVHVNYSNSQFAHQHDPQQ